MPLQLKMSCLKEAGWEILNASSVIGMNPSIIFSSPVLLQNLCGVVLQNQLGLRTDLGIFPSCSGGFPVLYLPAETFRF
jgi:hypothetical protein